MKSDTTKAPVLRRHREMLPLPLPLPLLRLLLLLLPGPGVVRPGDCRGRFRIWEAIEKDKGRVIEKRAGHLILVRVRGGLGHQSRQG